MAYGLISQKVNSVRGSGKDQATIHRRVMVALR